MELNTLWWVRERESNFVSTKTVVHFDCFSIVAIRFVRIQMNQNIFNFTINITQSAGILSQSNTICLQKNIALLGDIQYACRKHSHNLDCIELATLLSWICSDCFIVINTMMLCLCFPIHYLQYIYGTHSICYPSR